MSAGRRLAGAAVVLVVLVVSNVIAGRSGPAWDLTAGRSASLSPSTVEVLAEVDAPLRVTAFFGRDEPGRVDAVTLLSRYRAANRRVSFSVADPAQAPGEARRLGVVASGSAALEFEGRVEVAQDVIEIDVTSAIARLLREQPGTVCFATGHGERSADERGGRGLSLASAMLRDNGYHVADANLLSDPRAPFGCDAVVVAAPEAAYGDEARGALLRYLRGAGKALVLADPESTSDLSPLSRPWGISFDRGILVERDPAARLRGDPVTPIVTRFVASVPVARGLPPTLHPGTMAVVVDDPGRPSLSAGPLAVASPASYLEREPAAGLRFDEGVDRPGAITVGASADDSRVEDVRGEPVIRRTRLVAFGDVDFASNRFFADGGNARLLLQAVDWLTQPEPLIGAVPTFPSVRELRLTQARASYMGFVTTGVIPAAFLLAGALTWAVRRGR